MGMFSEYYANHTFKPTFIQRLKFLFCKKFTVTMEGGDCHETTYISFNGEPLCKI